MLIRRILVLVVLLAAAGCASVGPMDCGSANWRQLGWRDGSASGRDMLADYTAQCGGVKPDADAYGAGWQAGNQERLRRRF